MSSKCWTLMGQRRGHDLWPRGLSLVQAAAYVGIGTTLFDEWVKSRRRKIRFTIGRRVLYDRHAIDAEIDEMMDSNTDPNDPYASDRMAA